jgi:hypothetical protein
MPYTINFTSTENKFKRDYFLAVPLPVCLFSGLVPQYLVASMA